MPTNRQQYSLSQAPVSYTPGVYQGFSMDFKPIDFTPLSQSLDKIEARINKAQEQQTAVDVALGKIESQLNPNEREWFASYKQNIKNEIQDDIDAGNFGSAIRKATKMAGEVASDSRILGRVEANAKYQDMVKRINSNPKIDKDTRDWWLATHQYNYTDNYDTNGNIIGGNYSTFDETPAESVNLTNIAALTRQLVAPERTSNKGSTTNYSGIGKATSNGQPLISSSKNNVTERITKERLNETLKAVLENNPEARAYLLQQREVDIWKLKQLEELENNAETPEEAAIYKENKKGYYDRLYGSNGFRDENDYIANRIDPILRNMAYEYKDTQHDSVYGTKSGFGGGNLGFGSSDLPSGFDANLKPESAGTVVLNYTNLGITAKQNVQNATKSSRIILGLNQKIN